MILQLYYILFIKTIFLVIFAKCYLFSHVQLFATPWIVACQAPLSMEFSRIEYWSGFPFPSPGDLPNPGIKARSPALHVDCLPSEPPGKPHFYQKIHPKVPDF